MELIGRSLIKKGYLVLYFIGPVLATMTSVFVVNSYNIPAKVFFPNIAAILIGIILSLVLILKGYRTKLSQILFLSIFSLLLLASTFIFPGQLNVHRWILISSINLNASMIILPILFFCINYFLQENKLYYATVIFIVTAVILTLQPDAGQATSFVLGSISLFAISKTKLTHLLTVISISLVVIFKSWVRVDLLEPVEYVEEILYMITSVGLIGYLLIIGSAIFIFYPFIYMITNKHKALPIAYGVYLICTFVVTELGHFPVPLFGAGASPIIGWYLMIAFMDNSK